MDMKKVFERIDELQPEMVKTLGELISFPSFRQEPAGGAPFGKPARECLDRALAICNGLGFETENVGGYAGTAKLGVGEPSLGILAHLDVVPAGDGWTYEPYKATVVGDRLFGRGAMDDKGPAVSVIYAMKALKDLNIPLKSAVELIVGTDEECGSSDIKYFKEHAKLPEKLFTPDASYPLINIEKGRIAARFTASAKPEKLLSLRGGKTVNAVPATASAVLADVSEGDVKSAVEKAALTVKFAIKKCPEGLEISAVGESAHASTPEHGDNALTALINVLSMLDLGEAGERLSGLAKIFPHKETDGKSAGVASRDEISGALTLAFSILDYESGVFSGAVDIRFPVCESVESLSKRLGKALENVGFKPEIGGVEPHCVPSDSPFIGELLSAYEAVTGLKGGPMAIGGGTYVHGISGGVAFGCEVDGEDNRIHGADEFIRLSALTENAKIFAQAIVNVCG